MRPTTSLAHAARGERDRLREARAAEAAVGDDAEPPQPEQVRAARRLGVDLRRAAPRSAGRSSSPPSLARGVDVAAVADRPIIALRGRPRSTLSATLPVKPSVTTTSAAPCVIGDALDVADEVERRAALGERARAAATTSRVPLSGSSPLESSATRGRSTPSTDAGERRAHERELDEVLGADLGVGADVEQRDRRAGDRERERERRAVDAPARA